MSSEESSQLLARTPHVTVVSGSSSGGGGAGGGAADGLAAGDGGDSMSPASTSAPGPYLVRAPTVTVEAVPSSSSESTPGSSVGASSVRRSSVNPVVLGHGLGHSSKPVLIRQDCTTFLHSSGGLGYGLGGSEESATSASGCVEEPAARSVPDLELHCRLTGQVRLRLVYTVKTPFSWSISKWDLVF